MAKHRDLEAGNTLPESWLDALAEYVSTYVSANFKLGLANATTLQLLAGTGDDLVAIGVDGKWRYIDANITAAMPGGAVAGTYYIWVGANDNQYTGVGEGEVDVTDYSFNLSIRTVAQGAPPASGATTLSRKVGELEWDGAAITLIRQLVGGSAFDGDVVARASAATRMVLGEVTVAGLGTVAGVRFGQADDAVLARKAAGVLLALTDLEVDGAVVPGQLTTAERNALAVGRRPHAGVIYNEDTDTLEVNAGTDAVPDWRSAGGQGPGFLLDFLGTEANIPPRTCPADGRYLSEAAEPGLFARIGHTWDTFRGHPAPPAGNFRVIDMRGISTIGKGNMGAGNPSTPSRIVAGAFAGVTRAAVDTLASMFGVEYHTLLLAETPSHNHGTGGGATTSGQSVTHTHSGTTGTESVDHTHVFNQAGHMVGADYQSGSGFILISTPSATGGRSAAHTHSFTTGNASVDHTHTLAAQGGGGSHENVPPVAVVNKLVTL